MTGIFIDLDGTLLNDNNEISNDDLRYLKDIKDKYNVYISTGKPYAVVKPIYDLIGLNTWLSTSQGMVLSKPNENIFEESYISIEDIKFLQDGEFENFVVDTVNGFYLKGDLGIKLKKDDSERINSIDSKILGVYIKTDTKVESNTLDQFDWDSGNGNIKVLRPKGVNKGTSMKEVIKRDNLTNTIFIGNGRADIKPMLIANTSIGMINSHENVLNIADVISKLDNNNSGVSNILIKILD